MPERAGRNRSCCLCIFGFRLGRVPTRFLQEDIPTTSGLLIMVVGSILRNGDPPALSAYEDFPWLAIHLNKLARETCGLWWVHLVAIAFNLCGFLHPKGHLIGRFHRERLRLIFLPY